MRKFWKEPQNIIAVGVTLISICALIVSITQTRVMVRQSELMETQARASVRPILNFGKYESFDPHTSHLSEYRLVVTNAGVGPATVDGVYVEYRGKEVHSWGDLFERLNIPDSIPTYIGTEQLDHTVVQAGQAITLLNLSNNLPLGRAIYQYLDSLTIRVLYSSIHVDQFEGRRINGRWINEPFDQKNRSFWEDSLQNN